MDIGAAFTCTFTGMKKDLTTPLKIFQITNLVLGSYTMNPKFTGDFSDSNTSRDKDIQYQQ